MEEDNSFLKHRLDVKSKNINSSVLHENNIYRNKIQQLQKQIVQKSAYISKLEQDLDKYIECLNDVKNRYYYDDQIIEHIYVCSIDCEEEKEKLQQYIEYLQHYL
ncbi:hypothetical protein [Sphaerospermopsis torques-reginae]|uniref:Uncharacterized protein n=1 Tax=Sphaerospermopsis torques-reginae ITEP-024 TaxID=984208 RepID=A0ABX8X506_9CYAN|nr:hypothetical protein [Sphaerospermopsis torques-reginae]QYX33762.1 hypothetical protein K2F26_10910 [Sphaerospermopsis torques-reginae ITEP-024]